MPRILVVEVNEQDAKLVQLNQVKKQLTVEAAIRVSFEDIEKGENAVEQRSQRIAEASRSIKNLAPEMHVIVPKQSVTLRRTMLPSQDPDELSGMVFFEAEKLIPFNVDRHTISYCVTEEPAMEGTEVLIGAIDEPMITQWLDYVKHIKSEVKKVDVSTLGLSHAALMMASSEDAPSVFAAIQIGDVMTDMTIVVDGKPAIFRSVRVGLNELLKALPGESSLESWLGKDLLTASQSSDLAEDAVKKWTNKLFTNFQRTIEFASRDYAIPAFNLVYFSGEAASLSGFQEIMQSSFKRDCKLLNPLATVPFEKGAVIHTQLIPCFARCYGTAHRALIFPEWETLNLLPFTIVAKQAADERKIYYAITSAIALIAIVIIGLYFHGQSQHRQEEARLLTEYLEELDNQVEQLDDREERIDIIRQIRSEQAGALDILGKVSAYEQMGSYTLKQGRLSLSNFEFELADEVRMDGYAMEVDDITLFVRYLSGLENNNNKIFEEVDIRNQSPMTLPRRGDTQLYQFQIVATLNTGE